MREPYSCATAHRYVPGFIFRTLCILLKLFDGNRFGQPIFGDLPFGFSVNLPRHSNRRLLFFMFLLLALRFSPYAAGGGYSTLNRRVSGADMISISRRLHFPLRYGNLCLSEALVGIVIGRSGGGSGRFLLIPYHPSMTSVGSFGVSSLPDQGS